MSEKKPEPKPAPKPKDQGYTGDICRYCGSTRMVFTGTCETCLDCGETSGCS